jgi:hypothetical protein
MSTVPTEVAVAFAFGVVFVVTMLVIAIRFPQPTPFQYNVFRTVLALAAAGAGAMLPGLINLEFTALAGLLLRAGGALALFVIIFFFNPAKLLAHDRVVTAEPPIPARLPNGRTLGDEQRAAFSEVWQSLVSLDKAGEDLWREVSDRTLAAFADRLHEASHQVTGHALFFSNEDYSSLLQILKAADFYLGGKDSLSAIHNRYSDAIIHLAGPDEPDRFVNERVRHQIGQNKRWLTRYRNLLGTLRSNLHRQVAKSA